MIFELDQQRTGQWDRFHLRKIGFAVQRLMASRFNGDARRMRVEAVKTMARVLGLSASGSAQYESRILSEFAVVLPLIPGLDRWDNGEKRMLAQVISAKAGIDEARYLRLMQRHERFRQELIRLGSL